ncbi:lysophospholipase, partial [Mycena olivaceomarginata]
DALHSLEDMVSDAYTEAWLVGTYLAPPAESKAVLVFIHGFAEHVGRYTEAHPQFAARGINVFTFDQRGFGKTALDEKNKSKSSAYGKTSGEHQMDDVQWAIDHAKKEFPGLPVLNFPYASSPLVHQTKPASKLARSAGGVAGAVLPYVAIPAPLDTIGSQELSHDAKYNQMCRNDPLSKLQGTLRGIRTCSTGFGEELLRVNYKKWPKTLPVGSSRSHQDHLFTYFCGIDFVRAWYRRSNNLAHRGERIPRQDSFGR